MAPLPASRALCTLACSATTVAALSLLQPVPHSLRDAAPPPGVPADFWEELSPSLRPQMKSAASGWYVGAGRRNLVSLGNATLDPCAGLDLTFERDHTLVMTCRDGVVCVGGRGFQSRAASTTSMILGAVRLLEGRGVRLQDFTRKLVEITDDGFNSCRAKDLTYTLPWVYHPGFCFARLIPDFTMWANTESGLLPNFTGLTRVLRNMSQVPPRRRKCGFAGSIQTNPKQRGGLYELAQQADVGSMLDFVDTSQGKAHWSMEEQVEEWACMIDVAGQAYSGRVPMLLHTGRPVLMVERNYTGASPGHFLDRMWYSDWLEPDVHYIPVFANLSNLVPALRKALSEEGEAIGRNAQRLAVANLTTEKSIEYIADILPTLADHP